jgi:hypothetical protein
MATVSGIAAYSAFILDVVRIVLSMFVLYS